MNMQKYDTRRYRGIPSHNGGDVMVNTGLSSTTACGHTIHLARDTSTKVAVIVVSVTKGRSPTISDNGDALAHAVELFTARADRFLGADWMIVSWNGEVVDGIARTPVAGKTVGYRSESPHL